MNAQRMRWFRVTNHSLSVIWTWIEVEVLPREIRLPGHDAFVTFERVAMTRENESYEDSMTGFP